MKKITIINGHPDRESFNHALSEAYRKGAMESGVQISRINLMDLRFNPDLQFGYRKRMDLEPDLTRAIEKIRSADHLVWIHPVWWGGFPARMKGFIDRVFLPGIAYESIPGSIRWKKLLSGRSARIITTLDQPGWYYRLVYGRPSVNQLRRSILHFCGIRPVRVSYFGIVKTSRPRQREKWLKRAYHLGKALA